MVPLKTRLARLYRIHICAILLVVVISGCASSGPPNTVSITPARLTLTISQTTTLAAVTTDSKGVSWTATGGSFAATNSTSGTLVTYTAPSTPGSYTITASSASDHVSSTSTVYVTDFKGMYTYHNDIARDGVNSQEYALTPSNVSTSTFSKLFSCPADGAVYAQPLWVANLTVNKAKHNVLFVATQHDSLYAFDADLNPCLKLWQVSLIDSAHGGTVGETTIPSGPGGLLGRGQGTISPEVGITGTPVIDPSSNTLYVVSKSMNTAGTAFYQRLHAIDLATGAEKFGGPANISTNITYPGTGDGGTTVAFNAQTENQRCGLALLNGTIYIAWASHEDQPPYYGWVVGFNAKTLAVTNIINVSPNVQYGGIWMGGGAPSADEFNNLYVVTGNAIFDAANATAPNNDYGDSFLRLSPNLAIDSYFTPEEQGDDYSNDRDLGAGGAALVLNVPTAPSKHMIIGGGKSGNIYLLDGDNLGGMGDTHALQIFNIGSGIFSTGAFWNNTYYIAGFYTPLFAYTFNTTTNLFDLTNVRQSSTKYGFPGISPSVSASGTTNGVVWALDNTGFCTPPSNLCGPTILHAYDATNINTELWNSSMVAGDAAGNAVKFSVPTIANGKVYVGTRGNNTGGVYGSTSISGEVDVYGLKPN